jgi:hypothetical protein
MGCYKDPKPASGRHEGSWVRTKKAKTPSQRENKTERERKEREAAERSWFGTKKAEDPEHSENRIEIECKERVVAERFKEAIENAAQDTSPPKKLYLRSVG